MDNHPHELSRTKFVGWNHQSTTKKSSVSLVILYPRNIYIAGKMSGEGEARQTMSLITLQKGVRQRQQMRKNFSFAFVQQPHMLLCLVGIQKSRCLLLASPSLIFTMVKYTPEREPSFCIFLSILLGQRIYEQLRREGERRKEGFSIIQPQRENEGTLDGPSLRILGEHPLQRGH